MESYLGARDAPFHGEANSKQVIKAASYTVFVLAFIVLPIVAAVLLLSWVPLLGLLFGCCLPLVVNACVEPVVLPSSSLDPPPSTFWFESGQESALRQTQARSGSCTLGNTMTDSRQLPASGWENVPSRFFLPKNSDLPPPYDSLHQTISTTQSDPTLPPYTVLGDDLPPPYNSLVSGTGGAAM